MNRSILMTGILALLAVSAAGAAEADFDGARPGAMFAAAALAGAEVPAASPAEALPARDGNKIIFGEDDRVEYYQVPSRFKRAAAATVSLWRADSIWLNDETGRYHLPEFTYGEQYGLCPGVRFYEQPVGAGCSGFLVGEDLVLTAGHCIKDLGQCMDTKFIFGYAVKKRFGRAPSEIPQEDVYGCAEIVRRDWTNHTVSYNGGPQQTIFGQDYALIRLDRKVTGREPLPVNRRGGIKKGDAVNAMGHPSGLPFKFSVYAKVVKPVEEDQPFFTANLDIFGGNSGGPAFNAASGLVEGVVVRADSGEFINTFDGCRVFRVNPQNAGYGVDINKLDEVLDLIPPLHGEPAAPGQATGNPGNVPGGGADTGV